MKGTANFAILAAWLILPLGSASAAPQPPDIVKLGEFIYSDTNLSLNKNLSCMSCHHPSSGFADPSNRLNPVQYPVSEGTVKGMYGGRNAPTSSYTGDSPPFAYDSTNMLFSGGMFWDGRATGATLGDPLAEQALGPFLNPVEMRMPSAGAVLAVIQQSNYSKLFTGVFGPNAFTDSEAYNNVGRAIAAFERSNKFMSFNSKFDKFWAEQGMDVSGFGVNGAGLYSFNPATFKSKYLTAQEANGLALINATDKGKCALCHLTTNNVNGTVVSPPLFTDFTYDNLGIPRNQRISELAGCQPIDYGLGAKIDQIEAVVGTLPDTAKESLPDLLCSGDPQSVVISEKGKFKVSTLRNTARSAPYGHNGYFATLEEIIHFYNTRDVDGAGWPLDATDPTFTLWPTAEVPDTVNHIELGDLGLSTSEEADIAAFIRTLSD